MKITAKSSTTLLLVRLREAESLIGSPKTMMFMDCFPEHRIGWLRATRALLKAHGITPENVDGPWHTEAS